MEEGSTFVARTDAESRARELRRRVANRRRTGVDILSSPLATQTSSLPQLVHAKHDAHEIRMGLIDMQSQHNVTLTYCDQQFIVEKNVRRLRKGIRVTQQQIRQKTEELDELQRRVLRLSKTLHDSSDEKMFAKTKLENQEEIRTQQLHVKGCCHCGRQYLPGVLIAHEKDCMGSSLPTIEANQTADSFELQSGSLSVLQKDSGAPDASLLSRFMSQPPRNLRVDLKSITHNTMTIMWDPPIFTGSNVIFDYELSYSICHSKVKHDEVQKQFDSQQPLRLSQWCLLSPIPGNQYRLTNLVADQEYGNFSICAVTVAGKSVPSNIVDIIRTEAAVPPTIPLFLCVGVVTATSITLTWTEPLDDGGVPIQDYEVIFTEAVIKVDNVDDRGKAWLNVSEIDYKSRRIRTNSTRTTLTIANLLSGVEHLNFQVRAVNSDGIQGDYSETIKSIFTIAPGNEFKLLDELQAAVNSRSRTVDSQFLSGFMQRYERHHYIEQISRFILSMHPDLASKVNNIINRANFDTKGDEVLNNQNQQPQPIQQASGRKRYDDLTDEEKIAERRRQFHFRIAEIRNDLKNAEYNVQWCKDRQIDLVALIRSAEARILEKQAELERARMFKGPQMDSDVFKNGLQRFFTKELIIALEDEIEIDQLYILDTKTEIVNVENYLRADIKRRDTLEKRLKDRHGALELFESNPKQVSESISATATLAKLRGRLLYRAFAAFTANRQEAQERRRKMRTAINRLVNHRIKSALLKWRKVAKSVTRANTGVDDIYGIGSIGLLNAALGRDDLMMEAQKLLHQLQSTGSSLQDIRWTTEQLQTSKTENPASNGNVNLAQELHKKYFPFILEGDAKMNLQDYEGSLRLYLFVHNNERWIEQMNDMEKIKLQLKVGEAMFRLENYEQALTIFNRASILANRTGLRYEEGSAVLRIADTQHVLRSLRLSIESYERALLLFEAVRDVQGELSCYRGLQRVYERLEDREMVEINKHHADDIEFAVRKKLSATGQRINKLQQRLVGAGAESACKITLERVGPIVPRLRRERIQRKLDIREEEKLVACLEKLLSEKRELLAKGEDDLKRALASDSSQVDSTIISGSDARYELEDFKKSLAKLMGSVKAGEEQIGKEITNSKIRISNAKDEIKGLEEELAVETGPLMRKVLSKERMRCFRFNATNEALKNVVGTTTHGITTCFASAGVDGFMFDVLSGACLAQAVGDVQKNHLGKATGHQAQILSVYYIGHRIYTGSADASLGVWDVNIEAIGGFSCSLTQMLTDFDAAVVSVVADTQWFACGCSDCDVFVFDAESLATIAHIISAHDRTVTTLSIQSTNLALTTGAADNKLKVWEFGKASQYTTRRNVKLLWCLEAERRGDEYFNGHLTPITCVRRVANEIVSGDSAGRIIIWNLDADNKLLRICDVHRDVAVTCLQVDATRIVSGANNGQICVTDFATGNLIQTLHGHQDSVLDLQFDRTRLMSMSADGKLYLWYWQTRDGIGGDRKKYHILGAGETLRSLSLLYRTSIQQLLQWNSIPDSTKTYLGQKLIVEIDASASASDELKTLDLSSSVQFGKLSYENLDFVASNKTKSKNVESQWAAQRLAMLAKEYFPPLDDEDSNTKAKEGETTANEEESGSGSEMDSVAEEDNDSEEGEKG